MPPTVPALISLSPTDEPQAPTLTEAGQAALPQTSQGRSLSLRRSTTSFARALAIG